MAMAGMAGTIEGTTAVAGIQGGITTITTVTVRGIIPVGTAGGVTVITPAGIGGALGATLTQVGGGLITIPVPIPMACLRQRSLLTPLPTAIIGNNLTTGTTAGIRRATIRMSRAVREAGHRWSPIQPCLTRKEDEANAPEMDLSIITCCRRAERMCNCSTGSKRQGIAGPIQTF